MSEQQLPATTAGIKQEVIAQCVQVCWDVTPRTTSRSGGSWSEDAGSV